MSSFLTYIRINEELKEKLHESGNKIVNFVKEKPTWSGIQIEHTVCCIPLNHGFKSRSPRTDFVHPSGRPPEVNSNSV